MEGILWIQQNGAGRYQKDDWSHLQLIWKLLLGNSWKSSDAVVEQDVRVSDARAERMASCVLLDVDNAGEFAQTFQTLS